MPRRRGLRKKGSSRSRRSSSLRTKGSRKKVSFKRKVRRGSSKKKYGKKKRASRSKSFLQRAGHALASGAGGTIGAGLGSLALRYGAGAALGSGLVSGSAMGVGAGMAGYQGMTWLMNKITGHGDYRVQRNTFVTGDDVPSFDNGKHRTRVVHREYIGDILSTSAFTVNSYSINPGLVGTFPWLANIAANWDLYEFNGLVFEYKSLSASSIGSSNTALGSVIMATQYNSTLANFSSKLAMENYEFSSSSSPDKSLMHPVECKRSNEVLSKLYTRTGAVPSGQDERLYDLGTFQIATIGMTSTTAILGELWATFDLTLYDEKMNAGQVGGTILTDHFNTPTALSNCPTSASFCGTNGVTRQTGSNIGCTVGALTLTFPTTITTGTFMINHVVSGGSAAKVLPTITATSNCKMLKILAADAQGYLLNGDVADGTATNLQYAAYISVTGPGPVVTWSGSPVYPANSSVDLLITQVNNGIVT